MAATDVSKGSDKIRQFWQTDVVKNPNGVPGGLPGMDKGQVQAITIAGQNIGKAEYDKAEELIRKGWDWITEQGQTKIIIKNQTSKDMKIVPGTEERKRKDQTIWIREPPPRIAAGKDDYIIVQTDMKFRGKTRAETSGSVVYKADGKDETVRASNLHLVWVRKGDRGLAMVHSPVTDTLLGYELEGHQSGKGEFTFFVREIPVANPKKPETGGGKVPDTFVLFDLNMPDLTPKAKSALHGFANAYRAAKSTAMIYVYGYASKEGPELRNETLSYQRAEAVFNYLSGKDEELPKGNIQWEGLKTTDTFDPDPKALAPNRRATISLTDAKAPAAKKEPQSPVDPKAKVKQTHDYEEPPKREKPHAAGGTGA